MAEALFQQSNLGVSSYSCFSVAHAVVPQFSSSCVQFPVAAATRFSVRNLLCICAAFAMSAHVVIKDTMRVLDIDGNNYDIDPIFTDSVISHVNILIEKGISSGEKVGILRQIISYMYTHFVAWDESSQPDQTGVHPGNRSTFGVGGTDSQHLGFNILSVGFAWEECKDATAIQAPPAPLNKEAKDYNDMLVEVSDGLIPPLRLIRCLTIAGGGTLMCSCGRWVGKSHAS